MHSSGTIHLPSTDRYILHSSGTIHLPSTDSLQEYIQSKILSFNKIKVGGSTAKTLTILFFFPTRKDQKKELYVFQLDFENNQNLLMHEKNPENIIYLLRTK